MPKYSFIVPVYGCEKYLEECVNSILAQKGGHDFEIILVDDGAKDRSGQIADELARQDPRVRTFHKENGGAASARNFGIREAKGQYLLFVDGDDTVEDQLLNSVNEVLEQSPDALVVFGMCFDYYRDQTYVRAQILSCSHEGCITVTQLLEDFKSFFYDNALSSACNKVFSAAVIREHGLEMKEGMTLYEDYDFVLRYLAHIEKMNCIPLPFYHYRNDLGAVNLDRRVASLEKVQENMRVLFSSILALSSESIQLKEVSANLYILLLWRHLKASNCTVSDLARQTTGYCAEPGFRVMLTPDVKMGDFENNIFQHIENGEFRELARYVQKKKYIALIKNEIKKIFSTIGLKRH